MKLSDKHRRFVAEYLIDQNATQAYIRAGYSAKGAEQSANKLLRNPHIRAAVDAGLDSIAAKCGVTAEWFYRGTKENFERAMQAVPVYDKDGTPTGEYRYDGAVANGALRLAGEAIGTLKNRHEHSGKNGGDLVIRMVWEEGTPTP